MKIDEVFILQWLDLSQCKKVMVEKESEDEN